MQATEIQTHARKLYETLGPKALAEAAQKAKTLAADGREADAETWRRIGLALSQMHGPHVS
ncbi:MAG: hypothetical protein ABL907_06390 [Hyphomicrobium sp.]